VKIDLLGPIRIWGDRIEITLNAAKERTLLAALALRPGKVVSSDELIEVLWGDAPPETARKTLQTYVSNVRRALGTDVIGTEPSGYVLRLPADRIDVGRFRGLINEGAEASRTGSAETARRILGDAIALWRGDPFTGVAPHSRLAAEAVRLKEEYLSVIEARVDADLALGRHAETVGELEVLADAHPFRERLCGQLMVALYRSGRQADALAAYQRGRCVLREELGLEPGGELRSLERAILDHNPSLHMPAAQSVGADRAQRLLSVPRSPVRYAVADDGVHVAYQVFGDGPTDVLIVPGFVCHLDLWSEPPVAELVRRLASCHRLIILDRRGSGLSDRPTEVTVAQWVSDVGVVLNAVGSKRSVVLGIQCGGEIAAAFAAGQPDRVSALVMYGAGPRSLNAEDYPFGVEADALEQWAGYLSTRWGNGLSLSVFAPESVDSAEARAFWARYQQLSASPAAAAAFVRAFATVDLRDLLPLVTARTLILHAARDAAIPAGAARLMAGLIPNSTYVELDSDVHLIWLSDVVEQLTNEIMSFIADTLPTSTYERVLSTVLCLSAPQPGRHAPAVTATLERHQGRQQLPTGTVTFNRPGRAIECALELARELHMGAAIHTGECALLANGDIIGTAVNVARSLAGACTPGQVLVTHTIRDLLIGSDIEFEDHSRRSFEGITGEWGVHEVTRRPSDAPSARQSAAPVGV
jgi:DNA-binding SARP family transcriptional activator/pimeloyl-ACP methyl ester carboxylesterase